LLLLLQRASARLTEVSQLGATGELGERLDKILLKFAPSIIEQSTKKLEPCDLDWKLEMQILVLVHLTLLIGALEVGMELSLKAAAANIYRNYQTITETN